MCGWSCWRWEGVTRSIDPSALSAIDPSALSATAPWAVGIDPHVLNSAVMYGTLYGPFGWVYFVAKRRCIHSIDVDEGWDVLPRTQPRSRLLLPTAAKAAHY